MERLAIDRNRYSDHRARLRGWVELRQVSNVHQAMSSDQTTALGVAVGNCHPSWSGC